MERSWTLLERSWDALGAHFRKQVREDGSELEQCRAPGRGRGGVNPFPGTGGEGVWKDWKDWKVQVPGIYTP